MSNELVVQQVVNACYPEETAALGSRISDVVEAAVLGEQISQGPAEIGRANEIWDIVKHVFEVTTFVKCVVDVVFAARKDGREVADHEIKAAATERKIYIPSDVEIQRILAETRRHTR